MAKPKLEKKAKDIKKLVREYWQSIESEDADLPPSAANMKAFSSKQRFSKL